MRQLYCRDLKPGDILLKMATPSLTHQIIQLGQKLAGQPNAFLAHAAVALDTQFAIEAQKKGVVANPLAVRNRDAGYQVYRCKNANLGLGAATCAKVFFDAHGEAGGLKYDAVGAAKSLFGRSSSPRSPAQMDAMMGRILSGRGHKFFCSQFVVAVYQFAAEQSGIAAGKVFNVADAKVSPSDLASLLLKNPYFEEAGYMMPNER
jgi:hypothetical protein